MRRQGRNVCFILFFFQAEDGIRDLVRSRGLGDVYKRQAMNEQFPGMQPSTEPLSVKEWFVTLFITYIPLVGLIMLLVWAFDSSTNINKKNFAKASLIWMLIGIALAILFLIAFAGLIMSLGDSYN